MSVLLSVIVITLGLIPLIAYLDYYLLFPHATCKKCGERPDKHAWLLATTLEVLCLISGILIGRLLP